MSTYTLDTIADMKRTARNSGAVGAKARTPRAVLSILDAMPDCARVRVVDFGCGYGQHLATMDAHPKVAHVAGRELHSDGRTVCVGVGGMRWPYVSSHAGTWHSGDDGQARSCVSGPTKGTVEGKPVDARAMLWCVRQLLADMLGLEHATDVPCERVGGTNAAPVWVFRLPVAQGEA